MARVRVEPAGVQFDVALDESIMAAAVRQGYRWPTVCGGMGSCRTCFLTVVEGSSHLSPVLPYEQEGLNELGRARTDTSEVRLACQVKVTGDAVVHKRGVRLNPVPTSDAAERR